mmetsp:Transcript_1562/g.3274  ORF Transcript_1562/g.3274 Transcript_1562/m.3274 type:complete len:340 (+) Transcript_1562:286-1305(+)
MWSCDEHASKRISISIPAFFSSNFGLEAVQIYLWLLKDLVWMQAGFKLGYLAVVVTFPSIALIYLHQDHRTELMHSVATLLWVTGNYWWMLGENWDDHFHGGDGSVYRRHTVQAEVLLGSSFTVCLISYLMLIRERSSPFSPVPLPSPKCSTSPPHRFTNLIHSFREYDNLHILFWTGKDLFWALELRSLWMMFAAATLMLATDVTWLTRKHLIEHMHSWVLLLWIAANIVWGVGEFFEPFEDHTKAQPMGYQPSSWYNLRWFASWITVSAIFPLTNLYVQWIPATLNGLVGTLESVPVVSNMLPTLSSTDSSVVLLQHGPGIDQQMAKELCTGLSPEV